MSNSRELLEKVESCLQQGEVQAARDCLDEIKPKELSGALSAHFVRMCWRSGRPEAGLRHLNPFLKNKSYRAMSIEWAEYAMCLNAIGAVKEGRQLLLEQCRSDAYFDLYMGFTYIYEWDYNEASKFLEQAVSNTDLPGYQLAVARVNLLSCYVAEERAENAEKLFQKLNTEIPIEYRRLRLNLRELELQLLVLQGRFDEALNKLQNDFGVVPTSGPEVFYYKKWKTLVEVEKGIQKIESLLELRNEALESGMWEVARDCEARIAYRTGNPIFLKRIYYSTPWSAYRQRILSKYKNTIDLSGAFDFWMAPRGMENSFAQKELGENVKRVDVENGILGAVQIKKGSLAHRLLRALCSDLYRPHSLGGLFYKLFDNEKFDLGSSPTRIYRAVNELRDLLQQATLPLNIEQSSQGYRLVTTEPLCLILPSDFVANKSVIRLLTIKESMGPSFAAADVVGLLKISLRTAQRLLNEAIAEGEIEKCGEGAKTIYRWLK